MGKQLSLFALLYELEIRQYWEKYYHKSAFDSDEYKNTFYDKCMPIIKRYIRIQQKWYYIKYIDYPLSIDSLFKFLIIILNNTLNENDLKALYTNYIIMQLFDESSFNKNQKIKNMLKDLEKLKGEN